MSNNTKVVGIVISAVAAGIATRYTMPSLFLLSVSLITLFVIQYRLTPKKA